MKNLKKCTGANYGKRLWRVALLCGITVCLLSACTGGSKTPVAAAPAPAPEPAPPAAVEPAKVETGSDLGPGITALAAEKEANPELERTIVKALEIPEEEAAKTLYLYNYVDLNADGTNEILALVVGPYTSGSGGSTALHVLQNPEGFQVNQIFTLMREPLIISDKMNKGCHEIIIYQSGGGAEGGYVALASSDGQYQTANAGTPLANLEGVTGTAIMSNDIPKDIESGAALYLKK